MKKTHTLILSVITLIITVLFIYSCTRKDKIEPKTTDVPGNLIQAAKDWHANQTHTSTTLSINVKSHILQPIWKEAKLQTLNNGKSVIIVSSPIFNFDATSSVRGMRKFVFSVVNGQVTDGRIIETFGNSEYMSSHADNLIENIENGFSDNFTGAEIVYDVNYRWVTSAVYKDGAKLNSTSMIRADLANRRSHNSKGNLPGGIVTLTTSCYDYWLITTNLFTGQETWTYLYSACENDGGYGDSGGGGGGTGPGAPPSQPLGVYGLNNSNAQIPDSNFDNYLNYAESLGYTLGEPYYTPVNINGVLYYGEVTQIFYHGIVIAGYFSPDATSGPFTMDIEYNIGDGDTDPNTPSTSTPNISEIGTPYFGNYIVPYTPASGGSSTIANPVVKTNPLTANFPCATSLIINRLLTIPQYSSIVAVFSTIIKPDLIWQNAPLTWNTPPNIYELGHTGYTGRSAEITLNTSMLQNSSKLFIAAAAIHETIHAYINYNIESQFVGYGPPPMYANDATWFYALECWVSIRGLPANYSNHYVMLSSYFSTCVSILAAWDHNAHTMKQYEMTMLFGLDNASDGTAAQKTILQTEYNNLKTQYGITDADLTSFYNPNLTAPVAQRLPTSGC